MSILKKFVSLFPGGAGLAERYSYRRRKKKLEKIGDARDRFTHIYARNKWKNEESRSGAGSTKEATESIRAALPELVLRLGVKTILDVPCGDFNWMRAVRWPDGIRYIGGDIVSALIAENQKAYGSDGVEFIDLNLLEDRMPEADLLLCRDCFIHLSYADIGRAMQNVIGSGIGYLLASSYIDVEANADIPTGHCRMINLQRSPLSFPEPLEWLDDASPERPDKRLGLWSREQFEGWRLEGDTI